LDLLGNATTAAVDHPCASVASVFLCKMQWMWFGRRAVTVIDAEIIKAGRTPRIAGSRITIYDVLDYHRNGWCRDEIAALFDLSSRQVEAAIRYIDAHQDEVMAEYELILARHARGNPPELEAKLNAAHERLQAMLRERRQRKGREAQDERHSGRH